MLFLTWYGNPIHYYTKSIVAHRIRLHTLLVLFTSYWWRHNQLPKALRDLTILTRVRESDI